MARPKNDGRGRIGGRQKGTPNKVTTSVKAWIKELVDGHRDTLEADLMEMSPKERWDVIEKLLNYIIPKQQSVQADVVVDGAEQRRIDREQAAALLAELEARHGEKREEDDDEFEKRHTRAEKK